MSTVFLASRAGAEYRQAAAIKIMPVYIADPAARLRFRLERQILADLRHPNIASLIDGGTTAEGLSYIVMEHIDGQRIDDHCHAGGLCLASRLALFQKICAAVDYAHRNLIIHRDIKATNVLIDGNGEPKLLDFGIAKLLGEHANAGKAEPTDDGFRIMTLRYASPEQIRDAEPLTTMSDVYSLGVLLYKIVVGRVPFTEEPSNPTSLARATLEDEPVRPSRAQRSHRGVRGAIPADLDTIILKCLQKDPERRYKGASELSSDLRRFLDHAPIRARDGDWWYYFSKCVVRHARTIATAATFLILISGFSVYHTNNLRSERDAAARAAAETQVIADFLTSLFNSASPFVSRGEPVTAIDMLQEGERRIDALAEQDLVQARLYLVMGDSYTGLGEYERALTLLETAAEIIAPMEKSEPLLLAESLDSLAEIQRLLHNFDLSMEHKRKAIELRASALGEDHKDVAYARARLAAALGDNGQHEDAIIILQQARDAKKRFDAEIDAQTLDILGVMAANLAHLGRYEEAYAVNADAIAPSEKLLGELEPNTVTRIGNAGVFLYRLYRFEEALRYFDLALERGTKIWPDNHSSLAYYHRWSARLLQEIGRFDEARAHLDAASAVIARGENEADPGAVFNHAAIGLWHLRIGDFAKASTAYQTAVSKAEEHFGINSPASLFSKIGLGSAKRGQGRLDEAHAILSGVHERRDALHKSEKWLLLVEMGSLYTDMARRGEAEEILNALMREQQNVVGADSPILIPTLIAAAENYLADGRIEEAAILSRQADAISGASLSQNTWLRHVAGGLHGRVLLAQNQTEAAAPILDKAHQGLSGLFTDGDARVREIKVARELATGG